jgi:hypothetical protein
MADVACAFESHQTSEFSVPRHWTVNVGIGSEFLFFLLDVGQFPSTYGNIPLRDAFPFQHETFGVREENESKMLYSEVVCH